MRRSNCCEVGNGHNRRLTCWWPRAGCAACRRTSASTSATTTRPAAMRGLPGPVRRLPDTTRCKHGSGRLSRSLRFWNGNPQRAADLAQHGQRYAASGSVGVRLASLEARALAVAGDAQGAVAALVTAEQARDAMQGPDVMPGVFSFPTAKQLTYAGTTHLAIGGPGHVQQAIDCAGTAVDLYRVAAADDRSTFDLLASKPRPRSGVHARGGSRCSRGAARRRPGLRAGAAFRQHP